MIIIGSPDPHGPEKARSRDGYYGIDLALFLGAFLQTAPKPNVKLDTEVKEQDLKENNLIIIGGPIVNHVTELVNAKLPVRFDKETHFAVKSTISGKVYPNDEIGMIVKAKNPFNPEKSILVVAGKRYPGTRAAILAFTTKFQELSIGNIHQKQTLAKVVEGIDYDSDGIVDDVEIRE
ncbi:MAG: S-layer protein [Nanoarchaeota archaeon]|nr:MAG: S-layer protein [Nanoarchaeota archaeon]